MKYTMLIIFILSMHIYAQETNSIKLKMDTYETNTKLKWNYNPFKNYDTDRYFSSWADPNAYNSSFLLGKIFNIKEMYKNPNFKFDNIDFFYQPTLATEVTPISFKYMEKHRFKIGVGFLTHFFLSKYKNGTSQYYGQSLMYGSCIIEKLKSLETAVLSRCNFLCIISILGLLFMGEAILLLLDLKNRILLIYLVYFQGLILECQYGERLVL